jgi:hypothetical protein
MKSSTRFSGLWLLCLLVFSTLIVSCDKDTVFPDTYEYFTFGEYYCECTGTCGVVYQIKDDAVFPSIDSTCTPSQHEFGTSPLISSKYEIANALIDEFPEELLNSDENTYGCPDCADQGGYYIELKSSKITRSWRIDRDIDELPGFLKTYAQTIESTIDEME